MRDLAILDDRMQLIRGLRKIPSRGTVATIGTFDGVHLGHRYVIDRLAEVGGALGLPVTVILFEPQPREYFTGSTAPARLTRLREKLIHLKQLPVDRVLLLRFNRRLAALPAVEFIDRVLVNGLGINHLVVGDDFRFGCNREGDFNLLKAAGKRYGFNMVSTPTFTMDGARVSSTRIREALERGDLARAARYLGRTYSMCGRVTSGQKRGRDIGFPTANLNLYRRKSPITGVFAVTVEGVAPRSMPGVANVGIRPTIESGDMKVLLEVHLFDFDDDLYGRQLEVFFHHKIRGERRFASLEALREQIQKDAAQARHLLQSQGEPWTTRIL